MIDIEEYDLKQPFLGIKPIPKNLIIIKNQKYKLGKEIRKIKPQFLPKNVFLKYQSLNNTLKKEIGRCLNIKSGYRSPAYQTIVFFYWLFLNNWNIRKTLKKCCLPGYSEHSDSQKQGIDFLPVKAIANPKDFYKTKEYKWLLKNGKKFHFYLSYPRNNKFGMSFEPWHWHFNRH